MWRRHARLLAAMGESQQPAADPPPDERQEQLKVLRRHLDWLRGEAVRVGNGLGAAEHSPWTPRSVLESLQRTLRELEDEAARIDKELHRETDDARWNHKVNLLTSIQGLGWASAVLILSELPPVERCSSAKQWAAFAGICPAIHESGKVSYRTLSRMGSFSVRKGVYLPAMSSIRFNPSIQALNQRLHDRALSQHRCLPPLDFQHGIYGAGGPTILCTSLQIR
jgi:transposase